MAGRAHTARPLFPDAEAPAIVTSLPPPPHTHCAPGRHHHTGLARRDPRTEPGGGSTPGVTARRAPGGGDAPRREFRINVKRGFPRRSLRHVAVSRGRRCLLRVATPIPPCGGPWRQALRVRRPGCDWGLAPLRHPPASRVRSHEVIGTQAAPGPHAPSPGESRLCPPRLHAREARERLPSPPEGRRAPLGAVAQLFSVRRCSKTGRTPSLLQRWAENPGRQV